MRNPVKSIKDAVLAERINQGDVTAFAEAYDLYAPKLLRHLALRTADRETAEDLLSKVFLQAWEYVRTGKSLRYLQSFLYTVTNNVLTDHYRRNAKAPIAVEDITLYDKPIPSETIPMIDGQYDRVALETALAKIKPEFRAVLVMRFIDELEIQEISHILEISPNALYVRIHRGLKSLREVMDPKYAK